MGGGGGGRDIMPPPMTDSSKKPMSNGVRKTDSTSRRNFKTLCTSTIKQ